MAQSGYTPIQHYRTSTASAVPTAGNLADGEFALNLTDEKLYFKNASGVVKLLASSGGASGSVTSVDASGGTTGLAFSGGPITSSGTLTLGGTLGVANGGTGVTSLTSGYLLKGNGTSAVSASTIYDTGTNVGIGTSSPASKLQVQQTTDGEIARLQRSGGPNVPILKFSLSEAANVATIEETGANAGALAFSTGAAERLYIASNGYVGVGTTTPSATLDVAGTGRFSGTLSVGETLSTGQGVSTGDATVEVGGLRTGSGVAYIDMHSTASSDFETRIIRYAGANGALDIINLGTGAMSLAQIGVAPLLLKTSDTERVRISGAGDVGIGTSAPVYKLHVAGDAYVSSQIISGTAGTTTIGLTFGGQTTKTGIGCPADGTLSFYAGSSTERLRVTSAGAVGIGVSSVAGGLVQINAQVTESDGTDLNQGQLLLTDSDNNTTSGLMLGYRYQSSVAEYGRIQARNSTGATGLALQPGGGNVGIGTGNPDARTTIQDGGGGQLTFKDSGGTTRAYLMTSGAIGAAPTSALRIRGDSGVALGALGDLGMYVDTSNNVGIGTSTPSEKLVVSGNAIVTGTTSFRGVAELGGTVNTGYSVSTGDCAFEHGALRSGDGNTYIDIHSTPSADYESRILRSGGLNGAFEIANKGTGSLTINAEGAANIRLSTSGTERLRVGPSGNVGIGTSSPATLLDVAGTVTAASFIGAGTGLSGTAAGLTAGSATNAANLVTSNYSIVESGGYVYIKYGSTNICRIDSSGNAVFRGNVTGNDTSI